MPIKLEQLQQPNAEDIKDLVKIYQDYPDTADYSPEQLQQWLAENLQKGKQLLVGRFNSRLAVAGFLTETADSGLELSQLCVRKATRQRGVARQLIQLLMLSPLLLNKSLSLSASAEPCPLDTLLKELGFTSQGASRVLEPMP